MMMKRAAAVMIGALTFGGGTAASVPDDAAEVVIVAGNHVVAESDIVPGVYRFEQSAGDDYMEGCELKVFDTLTRDGDELVWHLSHGGVPGPYFVEIPLEAVVVTVDGCSGGWVLQEAAELPAALCELD